MKTTSAIIKLTLWTSKTLKDNTHPIMLTIRFKGQSLISSHVSCLPKDWSEKNQCLKKNYPNSAAINSMLLDLLNRANAIRTELDASGVDYNHFTIADRLRNASSDKSKPKTFKEIMVDMSETRSLRASSAQTYNNAYVSMARFLNNQDFIPSDITDDVIKRWASAITVSTNTKIIYLEKISTILHYAELIGIVFKFPHIGIDYIKKHNKRTVKHRSLKEHEVIALRDYYQNNYQDNLEGMLKRTSKQFALGFWLSMFDMQGLAPADVCLLRKEQVSKVVINGMDCFKILTRRIKTSVNLTIVVISWSIGGQILEYLLQSTGERGGFVFPVFDQSCDLNKRMRTLNTRANAHLKDIAQELGIEPFTLYSARHSYASIKIKNGADITRLAHAMGRNVSGISRYIQDLSTDEDLFSLAIK